MAGQKLVAPIPGAAESNAWLIGNTIDCHDSRCLNEVLDSRTVVNLPMLCCCIAAHCTAHLQIAEAVASWCNSSVWNLLGSVCLTPGTLQIGVCHGVQPLCGTTFAATCLSCCRGSCRCLVRQSGAAAGRWCAQGWTPWRPSDPPWRPTCSCCCPPLSVSSVKVSAYHRHKSPLSMHSHKS